MAGLVAPSARTQSIAPARDGTGTIVTPQGNQFDITGGTLSSDRANLFHSFQQFGLDANQIANFISNPQIQNILGRVAGGDPSVINGLIQVTGGNSNLFLLNPAGILFGPNASLNVPAAFTATTATGMRFGDQWWSAYGANPYSSLVGNPDGFALLQAGPIANAGTLVAAPGQSVTLIGGTVVNTGTIATPGGKVTIAALPGDRWVRLSQEGSVLSLDLPLQDRETLQSPFPLTPLTLPELLTGNVSNHPGLIVQSGKIDVSSSNAQGGMVQISAKVAVLDGQVNASGSSGGTIRVEGDRLLQTGQMRADGQRDAGGQVQIQLQERGIQTTSGLISVQGGSQGKGGTVQFQGGTRFSPSVTPGLFLSGQIDASGQQGGTVQILGQQLDLYDAQIRANGVQGGGTILVGGDFQGKNPVVPNADRTTLNFSTTLQANAFQNGSGGRVIVWSNQKTEFAGTIQARGGLQSGEGGFVEVSGQESLGMGGQVEVGATNGRNGTLLLDPKNIIISETTGIFPQFDLIDPNQGG
ncbi:MAG: filamentous hemagglutinin N-terminal domain-containing protein, partial [Leptolyngbyaceae cyanobacterium bins.59]|nr:filamentous hemagglutinin N-terminal domain-containing protein [Leptolyngbyaceae cyanobacterium bins.59]